jgi:hypothetical protein
MTWREKQKERKGKKKERKVGGCYETVRPSMRVQKSVAQVD